MRLLFIGIIALAFALGLGIFLQDDPGRFVFSYGGTTIQTSFALFVIILMLAMVILYLLFTFLIGLFRIPKNYRRWSLHRGYRRSEKFLTTGLMSMLEGDWKSAEEAFRKGAAYSRLPMLNYLFAAKAAQQQESIKRRDHYLRLAHDNSSDKSFAVGLTQAELQLNQKQTEQAYATLRLLDADGKDRNQVKLMLLDASTDLMEWQQVLDMLTGFGRSKLLPAETIKSRQLQAYAGLMKEAGTTAEKSHVDEIWAKIPKKLQSELYLIEVYVGECLRYPDNSNCEQILRKTLGQNWDPALVRLYGMVEGKDIDKQLVFAERMLATHALDAALLLSLGSLCKRNSLWGKARTYLEESIAVQPNPEAYQEIAALHEQQGEHTSAAEYYQAGLNLATGVKDTGSVKLLESSASDESIAAAGARSVV